MTLEELIKQYEGKPCEVAGSANAQNQCVDLANAYIRDVLDFPIIEWTNAKDFPSKASDNYDYIKNTPEGVPTKGDLVIWNENVGGGCGHIAIFIEGTTSSFTSFDQNWSIKEICKIENHRYNNVDGWLHPKENMQEDEMVVKKTVFSDLVGKSSRYDEFVKEGYESVAEVKQLLSDMYKSIEEKNSAITAEKSRAETFRIDYNSLIALCALNLGTQQELNQIKVALEKVKAELDQFDDLQRNFAALQITSGKTEEELRAEIAKLKALLQQEDVLANVELTDLLKELVKRLVDIVKGK